MNNNTIKGLVGVGLPVYNRPESLQRILNIISSQTYLNLEIIVSDNASPDVRVMEVIEDFSRHDSRVKFYRQEQNKGVLANAEFVLKKSRGEYFTWFSDDDWRSPEFIEILVAELENNGDVDMVFCDYHEVYEDGIRAVGYPKTHLGVFKPFANCSRLVRTISFYWQNSALGKCNIFYAIFRKTAIDLLDLKKISGGYQHLNMDCLIVFSLLQNGPMSISGEVMCTLTCGNKKYYSRDGSQEEQGTRSVLSKVIRYFSYHKKDRDLYIQNTNYYLEKIIIYFLFVPKLVFLLLSLGFKKIKPNSAHYIGKNHSGSMDDLKNRSVKVVKSFQGKKLKLSNITLIAMATRNVEETLRALFYSCRDIEFGSVKLLSHYSPCGLDESVEFIKIKKIKSIDEWSYRIIYELNQYVETDFALLIHADGFVVNPSSWRDEFLDYDYIGAPWPLPTDDFSYRDIHGNIVRGGNSVSLRSKRLLELPVKLKLPWEPYHGFYNEDGFICVKNRHIYESKGMIFAPLDVAKYFSHENMIPEVRNIKPFAFHKWAGSNRIYPKF